MARGNRPPASTPAGTGHAAPSASADPSTRHRPSPAASRRAGRASPSRCRATPPTSRCTRYPATDIFADCGAPVLAMIDGTVHEVSRVDRFDPDGPRGPNNGGKFVSLLGDDGVRYYGSHLTEVAGGVEPGARVEAGQQIGTVGRTGNANDVCHLHFGISPLCAGQGRVVDPARGGLAGAVPRLLARRRAEVGRPGGRRLASEKRLPEGALNTAATSRFDGMEARDPIADLRRIAFLLERANEATYRVKAFRSAADHPRRPARRPRWRSGPTPATLTELTGVGDVTARCVTESLAGRGAGLPAPAARHRGSVAAPRPPRRCARRCAATATSTRTGPTAARRSRRWRWPRWSSATSTWCSPTTPRG